MKLSDEELLKIGFDRKAFMETPLSTSFEWNERTFVYVMHSAAFHKVGVAANVAKRLETVQLHNPQEVTLCLKTELPSRLMALLVERTAHQALAPYHARGEWFAADLATVKRVLLPIAAAGRELRFKHLMERKRRRIEWERDNPGWELIGEDNMRISGEIHGFRF